MSYEKLVQHKETWGKKPLLRRLYNEWYQLINQFMIPGKSLEIGGGSGNFKEYCPHIISADIVPLPWTDLVMDAHHIPFNPSELDNIILFDVLHHLENPVLFFNEASRVLKTKGRIIMMEPYLSLFSYPVYKWLHPEPVDTHADPFQIVERSPDRKPFDANQAIPTLFFEKYFSRFQNQFPHFKCLHIQKLATLIYPLSGGFEKPALIPFRFYDFFRWMEKKLDFLAHLSAFRMLVVLENNN